MQSFNLKAAMLGICTLTYEFDYDDNIIVTGILNEKDVLEVPDFVYWIYAEAFRNSNIKHANIGKGVIRIGARAFIGCRNLRNLEIRGNIKYIGTDAFSICPNLKQVSTLCDLDEATKRRLIRSGIMIVP